MNIKKPNSFARYGNDFVAPLTTIDQIVKPSGERYTDKEFELMSNVENVMFGENGAGKNLLNPTLQTTTINGVTCTNNGDGTFTLNGTATSDTSIMFGNINLPSGNYKLIGCPSGGSTTSFNIRIGKTQSNTYYDNEIGNGFNLIGDNYYTFGIFVASGCAFNDMKFKPMVTDDLSATYDDFEPYVKSLKQLTNSALNMDLLWTNASPSSSFEPQAISLDLSSYKSVIIRFDFGVSLSDSYHGAHTYSLFLKSNVRAFTPCFNYSSLANNEPMYREILSIDDSGISFGNGKQSSTDGGYNNAVMIPTEIYGVR